MNKFSCETCKYHQIWFYFIDLIPLFNDGFIWNGSQQSNPVIINRLSASKRDTGKSLINWLIVFGLVL